MVVVTSSPSLPTVRFLGEDCTLRLDSYCDLGLNLDGQRVQGRVALRLLCEDGSPMAMATVNVPDVPLADDELLVKDYSENSGMLAALVAAGVVEDSGERVDLGYVTVPVCRLLVGQRKVVRPN